MKPQNKFQTQVVEASKTLPKITKEQVQWGYENGIDHVGHRTEKGVMTCTKCGHSWQGAGYWLPPIQIETAPTVTPN